VARFVDTRYAPDRSAELARKVFPTYRDMAVNGMPLRAIFVALAKKGREVR
jgi:hypothetical protein